jgi:ferrous iron transport protein B
MADWLRGLILDGIVAGVGAVLGFVPQMLVLFLFLAVLEACGYMARIAFILDRIFRRFAPFGKKFYPYAYRHRLRHTSVILSGVILKKTKPFRGDISPFIMELPAYRVPGIVNVLRSMGERGWSFIRKAGSVIQISAVVIWFLSSFGFDL